MRLPKITLPDWPPQDWRAWAALLSTIAGGAVMTFFAAWLVHIIAFSDEWSDSTQEQRIRILGYGLYMVLAGVIMTLLGQGMAINKRKMSLSKDGFTMEGGPADAINAAATGLVTAPAPHAIGEPQEVKVVNEPAEPIPTTDTPDAPDERPPYAR